MARIAGIELPRGKRADIALTYIYGIGRATALQILDATGVNWTRSIDDLNADEVNETARKSKPTTRWRATFAVKSAPTSSV